MATEPISLKQQLMDAKLAGMLADTVARHRAAGLSWRRLAIELEQSTGVEVTPQTLAGWFPDV